MNGYGSRPVGGVGSRIDEGPIASAHVNAARPGRSGPQGLRWPLNDAGFAELHLFCGERTAATKPYCTRHCRLAYRAPPASAPKKGRAASLPHSHFWQMSTEIRVSWSVTNARAATTNPGCRGVVAYLIDDAYSSGRL
ncbi:GcrA family cell cycle regulator [Shinella zoogloeoides]